MISSYNLEQIFRLILAVVLGSIIGIERDVAGKPAGLRTYSIVSLGSCLFTIISMKFTDDPSRIAASIVTGIGFIGAGVIIGDRERIVGITTAAGLWVTAAIGLSIGIGEYIISIASTILMLLALSWKRTKK